MEKFNSYDLSSFDVSFLRHIQAEKINYRVLGGGVLKENPLFHVKRCWDCPDLSCINLEFPQLSVNQGFGY